eukprot:1161471-Pelagomonas_calceolata.AAC.8
MAAARARRKVAAQSSQIARTGSSDSLLKLMMHSSVERIERRRACWYKQHTKRAVAWVVLGIPESRCERPAEPVPAGTQEQSRVN